jgi:3-oxoacyl-[acyl-carrier protein] reductase
MEDSLKGKIALITGGSRGIGRAIATCFARRGVRVLITYVSNDAAARNTIERLNALGAEADALKGDVSERAFATEAVARVRELYGGLDVLVNNAGITRDGLLLRMKPDAFDAVVRTNLNGAFYMTSAAAPVMVKQRSGRIINLSSVAGVCGNAGQVNYAASKAGVIGLTQSAAKELGSRGITVNAVAPGLIDTDMAASLTEDQRARTLGAISLGRLGRPEEVAALVAFLASDEAAYITGQTIRIDGGIQM